MTALPFFSKVDALAGNLQELYAVSNSDAPRKLLIPSPCGDRIFSSTSWLGRLLFFFYSRFDRFNEEWRNKTITKVMERTHRLYYELYDEALRHNQCIKDSIESRIAGRHVQEAALRAAKSFLTTWNAATVPFLEGMQKADYRFKEFLSVGFVDKQGRTPARIPFGSSALAKVFSRHQKIIDFEGYLGSLLPLPVLYKLSTGAILSRQEDETLTSFAKKIDRNADLMQIHNLNEYLRALVKCFKKARNNKVKPDLTRIATVLVKRKSAIFNQKDSRHLKWRKKFKPGDKLDCNGIEVVLGEAIGPKASGKDNNLVFEVANAPNLVVVFGINRLILPLKAQLAEEMSFGIRSAEYIQIEKNGKFALVEKLKTKVSNNQWSSTKYPLNSKDLALLTPISKCIGWFLKQNRTPTHFHPEYLMYDVRGELKCAKYSIQLPFSFIDMENYALVTAAGNPYVYKYLMESSGLLAHEHARYFREVVQAVCEERDPDLYILSQVLKVKDFEYVDRAKELVQEVILMRDRCIAAIKERGAYQKNMTKLVSKAIWLQYKEYNSASLLPPQIEEIVLRKFISKSG